MRAIDLRKTVSNDFHGRDESAKARGMSQLGNCVRCEGTPEPLLWENKRCWRYTDHDLGKARHGRSLRFEPTYFTLVDPYALKLDGDQWYLYEHVGELCQIHQFCSSHDPGFYTKDLTSKVLRRVRSEHDSSTEALSAESSDGEIPDPGDVMPMLVES